ncbi:MAG TPA: DUF1232 domain-containing protein [Anaerolineae bacterium]|nr:DUF1232 domain-containing protein [Anaerolineae bacterium]
MLERIRNRVMLLRRDITALYFAYQDERTPWYARVLLALVISMAISPIDLIPDFIPVLGYLDDIILVPLGIAAAIKMVPPEVMQEARKKAAGVMINKKFAKAYTVFVIILWALVVFWMIKLLRDYFLVQH